MDFFMMLGLTIFFYYLITFLLWFVLDSDIELYFVEKFGKPISSLSGKVIWITGAANGIGQSLAIQLAHHNVRLCLTDKNLTDLIRVKVDCLKLATALNDDDILIMTMDQLKMDEHQECFQRVIKHFNGQLDVLVNNAGRAQRGTWPNITIDVDRAVIELDTLAHVNLSRLYLRYLQCQQRRGQIYCTASVVGLIPFPFSASYTAAKYALIGYFRSLQMECSADVDVSILCPGPVFSNFLENCFTNKMGERFHHTQSGADNRMPTKRCAFLIGTMIANKMEFNFCGPFPFVPLTYLGLYYPNIFRILVKILGHDGLQRLRDTSTRKIE